MEGCSTCGSIIIPVGPIGPQGPPGPAGLFSSITVHLTSAQIKTLNSIPVDTGIPNPGLGKAIDVISADVKYTFGTIAFTSNFLVIVANTIPANQFQLSCQCLITGFSTFSKFQEAPVLLDNLRENQTINLSSDSDSLVGDGTAIVYIIYRVITI